jgi:hypothetical protein
VKLYKVKVDVPVIVEVTVEAENEKAAREKAVDKVWELDEVCGPADDSGRAFAVEDLGEVDDG